MNKNLLHDPFDKAYQKLRAEAHENANRDGVNWIVFRTGIGDGEGNGDFAIQSESDDLPIGAHQFYIARPGTTTYLLYLQECDKEQISPLTKKDWVKEGRLTLDDLLKKLGLKTKSEEKEEKRQQQKETREKQLAEKPKKKKKVGPSNKSIVFDAYSSGETDIKKLAKLVEGAVKDITIKSWLVSWKKGKNLPAGKETK